MFPFGFWYGIYGGYGPVCSVAPAPIGFSTSNTNLSYASTDFLAWHPEFGGFVPDTVLANYISLASASLNSARWGEAWTEAMGLFIAHKCALYCRTSASSPATPQQAASLGTAIGIQTSKSVDAVSVSQEPLRGLEGWGSFNLTLYGQELVTLAKRTILGFAYVP